MNRSIKTKVRFVLILSLISLISLLAYFAVSAPRHVGTANAEGGVLDLSGADFSDNLYPLNGEWEFYPGKLYTPEDFSSGQADGMELAALPAAFPDLGCPLPAYGTFRLTLKTGEVRRLMIQIPQIDDASIVWLNGEKVLTAGNPGAADELVRVGKNAFVSLDAENGVTEIVIQAASGKGIAVSGMIYSAWVGSESLLLGDMMFRRVALMGVIGVMLMMALYHFVLFLGSPKDKIYLWYVLYVLATALRISMETNGLIQLFAPNGMDEPLIRIYMSTVAVQTVFIALFTFEAFRMSYWPRKTAWRVVYGALGGLLALNIVSYLVSPNAPGWLIYFTLLPYIPLIIAAARRVFREKQPGLVVPNPNTGIWNCSPKQPGYMGLYVIALCLFLFWGAGAKLLGDNYFYVPAVVSNVFMALTQAVALSASYAETRRRAKDLAAETKFYHRMSHDILTPLTRVSTSIQVAKRVPENAPGLLTDAQADVMLIADMINKALRDSRENGGEGE